MKATLNVLQICRAAEQAEVTGNYQSGLDELVEFWDYLNPEKPPRIADLPERTQAELLLRAGALFGYLVGSNEKKQEFSKDLLTQAFYKFKHLGDEAKQAECANYLAVSYLRLGNMDESNIWLAVGLARKQIDSVFLHTIIVESLIKLTVGDFIPVLGKFFDYTTYFESTPNLFLKGIFYMNFALAKKNHDEFEESLEDFQTAVQIFRELGNKHYLALVENNIARLYQKEGLLEESLKQAVKALNSAEQSGHIQRIGSIYDTLAQIALDMQKAPLALHYSEKAIEVLETIDAYGYLVEACETKIRCHLKMNKVGDALLCFHEAMKIAVEKTGPTVINRLAATATDCFEKRHIVQLRREGGQLGFSDAYDLILPEAYRKKNIIAVECATVRLRHLGIDAGNILVIEKTEVSDGEFVALTAKYGLAYFGFLEKQGHSVLLRFKDGSDKKLRFPERDIKLLGRVVGVCTEVAEEWPVLQVQMLNL